MLYTDFGSTIQTLDLLNEMFYLVGQQFNEKLPFFANKRYLYPVEQNFEIRHFYRCNRYFAFKRLCLPLHELFGLSH